MVAVTPEMLLRAYGLGIFPMAESRDDPSLFWVDPDTRGVIPLDAFHLPRRLARRVRSGVFEPRIDRNQMQIARTLVLGVSQNTVDNVNSRVLRKEWVRIQAGPGGKEFESPLAIDHFAPSLDVPHANCRNTRRPSGTDTTPQTQLPRGSVSPGENCPPQLVIAQPVRFR